MENNETVETKVEETKDSRDKKEFKHRAINIGLFISICIFLIGCYYAQTQVNNRVVDMQRLEDETGLDIPYEVIKPYAVGYLDYKLSDDNQLQLSSSDAVLRIQSKDNETKDIMEISGESVYDVTYEKEGDVSKVRVRRFCETYPHCTIINWEDDKQYYGIMVSSQLEDEVVFNLIGADISLYEIVE